MSYFSLTWHDVTVEIPDKNNTSLKKPKLIIDHASGFANSGSLIAIMGPSGCGKTTLLGALSGRIKERSGVIKLNDTAVSNDVIRNISGYVHQHDVFVEVLTVLEHLKFMAALQLSNQPHHQRYMIIRKLLLELNLELQGDTTIRHLSGGEKRRLSLAAQLLKDPPILFCDEPTTGLDSYGAISVMQKLEKIALSGKIILSTIHQPSSQLFDTFHHILLMHSGQVSYQGSIAQAKSFFEEMDLVCPENYSPPDFYLKCMAETGAAQRVRDNYAISRTDNTSNSNRKIIDNLFFRPKKRIFFTALSWLLWRNTLTLKRDAISNLFVYLVLMIIAATVGSIYAFVKLSDQNSIQNIQGIIITMVSEVAFTNIYAVIMIFPGDFVIYLQEKNLYSASAYFISKFLSLIPICLVSSFGYTAILFTCVQFLSGYELWIKMSITLFLMGMASCGLGMACSANFEKVEEVELFTNSVETLLVLCSGFWIKLESLSVFVSWIQYFSPFYYGFEGLSNLYWREVTSIPSCDGHTQIMQNTTLPCFANGTQVLDNYDIYTGSHVLLWNFIQLNVLTLFFCIIGWAGVFRRGYYTNIY